MMFTLWVPKDITYIYIYCNDLSLFKREKMVCSACHRCETLNNQEMFSVSFKDDNCTPNVHWTVIGEILHHDLSNCD